MMKRLSRLVPLLVAALLLFGACASQPTAQPSAAAPAQKAEAQKPATPAAVGGSGELVVLHTNDFHGHPLKFENYPAPNQGGLPAIATFVKSVRARNKNVLVLDAGDVNTGRPESLFFKAEPDIVGYNYIGYDALTLGNHEFDNSRDILMKQMAGAKFPFLSANVKTKDGTLLAKPYIVKKFEGFTVGIFGLTTKETEIVGNPEYIKDLVFEDEVAAAKEMVNVLRNKEKVDLVIVLGHLGLYDTNKEGSRMVAAQVPGIDLIIDGHSHTDLKEPVRENGVPIVQVGTWGLKMGKAVIDIKNGKVESFKWEAVPINIRGKGVKNADGTTTYPTIGGAEIPEDPELLAMLEPYGKKVEAVLAEEVGVSKSVFLNKESRLKETPIGDLVADAMLWYTRDLKVDFAINNGGGIRTDLPQGKITKKNVYQVLPFDNSLMVLTLKGSDLQGLFSYIATIGQGKGAFPQVSDGISFTINYTAGKVEDVLIGGKPVDPNRLYKIATNSFMAAGGDGYAVFKKAVNVYDTSVFQRDVLIEYLKMQKEPIEAKNHGRIKIIGEKLAMLFGMTIGRLG